MGYYTKLDPEFKAQWCAELRSGKRKQGKASLRRETKLGSRHYKYCCVGVACNIVDPKGWNRHVFESALVPSGKTDPNFDWYGITYGAIEKTPFINKRTFEKLAAFNDDDNLTFSEIADWIEVHL